MSKRIHAVGIILTYNCAHLLPTLISRIPKKNLDMLIIVDDGSTDDIAQVAKKLQLKLYTHPHLGYGGNLVYGLQTALKLGADYMVEIHGDGQYNPEVIPAALAKAKEGYDLLLGSRFVPFIQPLRDGMPIHRYVANIGLSFIERLCMGIHLSEFHSGFRIYSKKLVKTVARIPFSRDHLFSFEIIAVALFYGLAIGEIPVRCDYIKPHTSIRIIPATLFALETFGVLADYMLATWGIRYSRLFAKRFRQRQPQG